MWWIGHGFLLYLIKRNLISDAQSRKRIDWVWKEARVERKKKEKPINNGKRCYPILVHGRCCHSLFLVSSSPEFSFFYTNITIVLSVLVCSHKTLFAFFCIKKLGYGKKRKWDVVFIGVTRSETPTCGLCTFVSETWEKATMIQGIVKEKTSSNLVLKLWMYRIFQGNCFCTRKKRAL